MIASPATQSIRRHLLASAVVLLVCGGGFAGFAGSTEVSGAVIASGVLVVDSFVKKVQHQTGGVIKQIFVKDGDVVHEGDVLLTLDDTVARANLSMITNELDQLAAANARAQAERAGLTEVQFPAALTERVSDPRIATLLNDTQKQFASSLAARSGQKAQLRQRLVQLRMQTEGLSKQIEAKQREIELIGEELVGVRELWQKNLIQRARVSSLERDNAKTLGELGQLTSSVGEIGAKISETELQILQVDQDTWKEDEKELEKSRTRTSELLERKISAEDQLLRLTIHAPQSGTVHELAVHTVGGVITAQGEPIMMIVPEQDLLKVEAKLQPQDVDQVHIAEKVQVRLSGLNARTTPELDGVVTDLSADSVKDPKTGTGFFKVRIGLANDVPAKLKSVKLVPGMPCVVFIQTAAPRTIISYLTKPLTDQMFKAFR